MRLRTLCLSLILLLGVRAKDVLPAEPDGAAGEGEDAAAEGKAEAEADEEGAYTTVITATRFDTVEGEVPGSVTVIDAEEAKDRPILNADDLLRTEASISLRRPQGPAIIFPQVLCFRGISGIDRVLVLLDELPLNDGLIGAPNLNMLPTDDILKVEILRGPFSALYGNHAMGGVVHVITLPGGEEPGIAMKTDLGLFDAVHGAMRVAGKISVFEAAVRYDLRSTDNYLGDGGEDNLDYLHHNLSTRFDLFRGSAASLKITGGYFDSAMGFNQYVDLRRQGIPLYLLNIGRNWKDNGYAQMVGRWSPHRTLELKGLAGFLYMAQSWSTVPELIEGVLPDEMLGGQDAAMDSWRVRLGLMARWKPVAGLAAVAGYEQVWDLGVWDVYIHENGSLQAGMDARTSTSAGFLDLEWSSPGGRLGLTGGLRVDRHSTFGFAVSPKVGAVVQTWKNGAVRWTYGRAFRAPSLAELYTPAWMRIPPVLTIGNEDLDPETIDAVDLGIEQRFASILKVGVTGFHTVGKNFIAFQMQPDGTEKYVNIQRVRTAGIEFESSVTWEPYLHLRLTYAWTWSEDVSTGEPISYVPSHVLGLSVQSTIPAGPVDLVPAFDMRFIGERWHTAVRGDPIRTRLEPHAVGNAGLQVRWAMLTFYLEAQNIWNAHYEETATMRAPLFIFFGGIKVEQAL